ncbi:sugar transferase [Photobacterium leiognathi subsp. mandapamensis]|uniref:sugar transferase n=1 Tax=Photobacterium leiognathi TaxID=553611 RepID=UPI003AF33B95
MKRIFDIISSFLGLIIISPVFIFIMIWILFDSKGEIFFKQERVGLNGKLFKILKFRTMIPDAEKKGLQVTVGDDPRITHSGKFLRKSKLDELPQLFNVLIGDMSIVGPRPEVPSFMNEYDDETRRIILSVRPGITDRASIEFTNEAELLDSSNDPRKTYITEIMPIKASYYVEYVNNHNFFSDISIIFATLQKILK